MTDRDWDLEGLSPEEQEVVRRLTELGGVMREQERETERLGAQLELDQSFARELRARLVEAETIVPRPIFAHILRMRLVRIRRARPSVPARPVVPLVPVVLTAAAVLVAVLVLLLLVLHRSPRPRLAFTVPAVTKTDLGFSFSSAQTMIRHLTPITSEVHPAPGAAYRGHLRLTASSLPQGPSQLRAFTLGPPAHIGPALPVLGFRSGARRHVMGRQTWLVAREGGKAHKPLHSLAVSLVSGELIYHDTRNYRLPYARRPLDRVQAIGAARTWLTLLGWPGNRMPLRSFGSLPNRPKIRQVVLGWIGVGRAAPEAATLWVTPNGSVIEVWAWPPVVRSELVPAESIATAWDEVSKGKWPVAVEGVSPRTTASGKGTVRRTATISVLSIGSHKVYLVPAYRFEGSVHLVGHALSYLWYSLAPAVSR